MEWEHVEIEADGRPAWVSGTFNRSGSVGRGTSIHGGSAPASLKSKRGSGAGGCCRPKPGSAGNCWRSNSFTVRPGAPGSTLRASS